MVLSYSLLAFGVSVNTNLPCPAKRDLILHASEAERSNRGSVDLCVRDDHIIHVDGFIGLSTLTLTLLIQLPGNPRAGKMLKCMSSVP